MSRDDSDADYLDGGGIEDYEDSTRAMRPSEHGETIFRPEDIDGAVKLIILRLRRANIPWRVIAKVMNRPLSSVHQRYKSIPASKRAYYEKVQM